MPGRPSQLYRPRGMHPVLEETSVCSASIRWLPWFALLAFPDTKFQRHGRWFCSLERRRYIGPTRQRTDAQALVAESQKNRTTIAPRLEGYEVPKVIEAEARDKERKANAAEPLTRNHELRSSIPPKRPWESYRQENTQEIARILNCLVPNLESEEDGEVVR